MKKGLKIIIVIVVAIILISTAFLVLYHPTSTKALVDTSEEFSPGQLDPATMFSVTGEPLLTALFQELVEYNGSSTTQFMPVLASHYTNTNDTNYTFYMRSDAKFSNGQPLNATSAWFSFARGIVMGQGPYSTDYSGILFNGTMAAASGIYLPWGIIGSLENAGYHIPTTTYNISGHNVKMANYTIAGNDLAYILSHFNYNATDMKVMEYKDQALAVNMANSTFIINSEHKYAYLLSDIAGSWGSIVEPSYVDAHGGVHVNTPNSYLDANGVIGSGPYVISSVGKGLSTIVIKANPDYWVTDAMVSSGSVPEIAKPASIKTVVIEYGLDHTDRLEDFDKGVSQISKVSPSSFKDIIDGFHNTAERNSSLAKAYNTIGVCYFSMNTQKAYTNNTNFRAALYDALNYSQEMSVYKNNYNGTSEAYMELGPLSPIYGQAMYNPLNYPVPTQNITAAIQNLTLAANAMHFYVTLPNGTKIGDTSGKDLSTHTLTLTDITPLSSIETAEVTIAIDSFKEVGLNFQSTGVAPSEVNSWTTPGSTPQFTYVVWEPDYNDPIGQQLIAVYDKADGGGYGGDKSWVDNSTLQSIFKTLDFKNTTDQEKIMKNKVEKIVYDQYAYMWLPMSDNVYFVSPQIHGFIYNPFTESYYYNLMTFTGKISSSTGFMTIYTLVADIEMAITNATPKF